MTIGEAAEIADDIAAHRTLMQDGTQRWRRHVDERIRYGLTLGGIDVADVARIMAAPN